MAETSEGLNLILKQDSGAKTPLSDVENVDKELEQDARAKDPINKKRKALSFLGNDVHC